MAKIRVDGEKSVMVRVKKITSQGNSHTTRYKNKHKRRHKKKSRGQGSGRR
jgi:hypothetical protein